VAANAHAELDETEIQTGKDVLSYSEIRAWKDCRWKHALRYRENLRPIVEARQLAFGQGVHRALAAWYTSRGDDDAMHAAWGEWFAAERVRLVSMPKDSGLGF